ncbi:unnamed protein product, partial [Phaeothamnion confervicola]
RIGGRPSCPETATAAPPHVHAHERIQRRISTAGAARLPAVHVENAVIENRHLIRVAAQHHRIRCR